MRLRETASGTASGSSVSTMVCHGLPVTTLWLHRGATARTRHHGHASAHGALIAARWQGPAFGASFLSVVLFDSSLFRHAFPFGATKVPVTFAVMLAVALIIATDHRLLRNKRPSAVSSRRVRCTGLCRGTGRRTPLEQ